MVVARDIDFAAIRDQGLYQKYKKEAISSLVVATLEADIAAIKPHENSAALLDYLQWLLDHRRANVATQPGELVFQGSIGQAVDDGHLTLALVSGTGSFTTTATGALILTAGAEEGVTGTINVVSGLIAESNKMAVNCPVQTTETPAIALFNQYLEIAVNDFQLIALEAGAGAVFESMTTQLGINAAYVNQISAEVNEWQLQTTDSTIDNGDSITLMALVRIWRTS